MWPGKSVNPPPLNNWNQTPMVIYTNNKISAQIYFQSKRPHTITKMNDNKNMDNNRVSEWL